MTTVHGEQINLTPRQFEVLTFLAQRERWSVGEIASALGVSSAAATKAVARLERKGLVKRAENMTDRRCVDVTLTRSGNEALRRDAGSMV
ncbi:MAG TPA: MarR family transcriptional regulator [Ktedonobacteraceae bacterium]|nr:MarR family transcriptional regulator [Ktedonobacteraceae bacterium]